MTFAPIRSVLAVVCLWLFVGVLVIGLLSWRTADPMQLLAWTAIVLPVALVLGVVFGVRRAWRKDTTARA